MDRPSRPASIALAALLCAVLLPACKKPGDGASGVQPPSDVRKGDQVPPAAPRQP